MFPQALQGAQVLLIVLQVVRRHPTARQQVLQDRTVLLTVHLVARVHLQALQQAHRLLRALQVLKVLLRAQVLLRALRQVLQVQFLFLIAHPNLLQVHNHIHSLRLHLLQVLFHRLTHRNPLRSYATLSC